MAHVPGCGTCGHYTQIFWRASAQLGCGTAVCPSGQCAGRIWVCSFSPPGNYVAQRPY